MLKYPASLIWRAQVDKLGKRKSRQLLAIFPPPIATLDYLYGRHLDPVDKEAHPMIPLLTHSFVEAIQHHQQQPVRKQHSLVQAAQHHQQQPVQEQTLTCPGCPASPAAACPAASVFSASPNP
eukprot:1022970-Pelagomonas_calceolata.AAC.2